MDVLLATSLVFFAVGTGLIITGRWRTVSRLELSPHSPRPKALTMRIGLALAATGALLLIAFVAIGMTMSNAVAA